MQHEADRTAARARRIAGLAARCQEALSAVRAVEARPGRLRVPDPAVAGRALADLGAALGRRPELLEEHRGRWLEEMRELATRQRRRLAGEAVEPVIEPEAGDRRFADPAWSEQPLYDYLKQSYLLTARLVRDAVAAAADGLDPHTHRKAAFYARQIVEAAAPCNQLATNPAALRHAAETGGESLERGLENLLADLERGRGELRISTARPDAFRVGRDLATTPGKVVAENELMQLIQYAPLTAEARRRPLLIVPPWINKFYVLDLRPRNSLVRFLVERGHTVFLISWANPDASLAHIDFQNYLRLGPLAAMGAVEAATGEREINLAGYCIGGTLTACALAHLAARGEGGRVASATLLTTLTDFGDPGELGAFIDDEQLDALDRHTAASGCLEAEAMRRAFSLLRPGEMIWGFVVNNYLLGREPPQLDLLAWNDDGTRMPAAMHRTYLRDMYQRNLLAKPGGLTLDGVAIDLGRIGTPCYFLSAREDHIAPWRGTYRGSLLFGGPVRFVLAESGHVAGVVNPPASGKHGYWTNRRRRPADPEAWLARAERRPGSWWPDWDAWLSRRSGGKVAARDPAAGRLPPIEDAPGRYVLVRAD